MTTATARIDDEVQRVGPTIKDGLKGHVDKYILVGDDSASPPIMGITGMLEKLNCKFLVGLWGKMLGGLCFKSVVGMAEVKASQVALGYAAIAIALLMYGVWRYAVDNVTEWTAGADPDAVMPKTP